MKKIVILLFACMTFAVAGGNIVAGDNTVEGVGQDAEAGGDAIVDAARNAKQKM